MTVAGQIKYEERMTCIRNYTKDAQKPMPIQISPNPGIGNSVTSAFSPAGNLASTMKMLPVPMTGK